MQPEHALWLLIQQFVVRGLVALKFLLAARLLGPAEIGLVGIAMLALSIVESLSDTGLPQAVVQSQKRINRQEAGAVWTLQLIRGVTLMAMLFALAVPISLLFNITGSAGLIALVAVVPLLRNSFNPGIFLVQRDRNFQQLSLYEASAAVLDLTTTLLLIHLGFGTASILLGNISSDSLKLIMTWTWYRIPLSPNFKWSLIRPLTSFGKWVWGSSIITLVLNQSDKVLVAKFLGTTEFGLYQVASRMAQLIVADAGSVLGQYLYPTFAQRQRISSHGARKYLQWIVRLWVPLFAIIAMMLVFFSDYLVSFALGEKWMAAVPVLRAMSAPMFVGSVIAILVAYLRGIGNPRVVTEATFVQLIVLGVCAPILLYYFAAIGMAFALAIAGAAAACCMFSRIYINK